MSSSMPAFRAPNPVDRIFNRVFGLQVWLGLGLPHNYLLEVRGRTSGKLRSTPVDVLTFQGKRFVVAPRGRTEWVRNVEVTLQVRLKKGWSRKRFRVRPVPDSERPVIVKAYLDRYRLTVQRYFPIRAGSPLEAFAEIVEHYPAFELLPE